MAMKEIPGSAKKANIILNDLKAFSMEAEKAYPYFTHLKEEAESEIIKIQNAISEYDDLGLANFLSENPVLGPYFSGIKAPSTKFKQMSFTSIQQLIKLEAVSLMAANKIFTFLSKLIFCFDVQCDVELMILQTFTLLIKTNTIVKGKDLVKILGECYQYHFFRNDPTALATLRQLVSAVFERIICENYSPPEKLTNQPNLRLEKLKGSSRFSPPKSLPVHAADGFMLFQDLVDLAETGGYFWLTRTNGLELLETILSSFPDVFFKHAEFKLLLKERICPVIIEFFSPPKSEYQQRERSSDPAITTSDNLYFPKCMRVLRIVLVLIQRYYKMLVTECEMFLSLVVKFLDVDKLPWQRALALEVLHTMCIQPELLKSFCQSYDMKSSSTKLFKDIVNALRSYVQSVFVISSSNNPNPSSNLSSSYDVPPSAAVQDESLVAGLPVGPGITPQARSLYPEIWLSIKPVPSGTYKPILLESLDKEEAPGVLDGYEMYVAYLCLLDIISSIGSIICNPKKISEYPNSNIPFQENKESDSILHIEKKPRLSYMQEIEDKALSKEIINATWCGLLAAFTSFIKVRADETTIETIMKAMQIYTSLCGTLEMNEPRDAFIKAMSEAPPTPHTSTELNDSSL